MSGTALYSRSVALYTPAHVDLTKQTPGCGAAASRGADAMEDGMMDDGGGLSPDDFGTQRFGHRRFVKGRRTR
jgi:hypothetical protein